MCMFHNKKGEIKLESNTHYKKVYISFQLTPEANKILTESAKRSNRKKVQEAKLRLEDHLNSFRSISELNHAVPLDALMEALC